MPHDNNNAIRLERGTAQFARRKRSISPRGHFQLWRTHHKEQNAPLPDRRLYLASLISGGRSKLYSSDLLPTRDTFPYCTLFRVATLLVVESLLPAREHLRSSFSSTYIWRFMAYLINDCFENAHCNRVAQGSSGFIFEAK